jgi:hypothetical protein
MAGFFERITGTHTCDCGAKYRVTATRTPFPDTDDAKCEKCGTVMDIWHNSTSFRSYDLVAGE